MRFHLKTSNLRPPGEATESVRDDDHQFKAKQYRKWINIETLRPALSATLSQQTENRVMDGGQVESRSG